MQNIAARDPERETESPAPFPRFTATLLPHRSLSRKGFLALMLVIAGVSFLSGALFVRLGAWPVTGFFGLNALLCYAAFGWNYRAARICEKIELGLHELRLTRIQPSGKSESWTFNPYWVRFEHIARPYAPSELSLTSHGRRLVFGAFLANCEKASLASALSDALARRKSYSSIH